MIFIISIFFYRKYSPQALFEEEHVIALGKHLYT